MLRRFGDAVRIDYNDVMDETVRSERVALLEEIENRGLLYPVTVIDGVPVYDGAVSYPAILRAVGNMVAGLPR